MNRIVRFIPRHWTKQIIDGHCARQLIPPRGLELDLYYWKPRLVSKPYASVAGSVLPNVKYSGFANLPTGKKTLYVLSPTSYRVP
jgi:hypothetical protein